VKNYKQILFTIYYILDLNFECMRDAEAEICGSKVIT
jgi:hypothetical protein